MTEFAITPSSMWFDSTVTSMNELKIACKITVEQQADIENLRNLMFVRSEQSFIEGFDNTDIDCMIQYIIGH